MLEANAATTMRPVALVKISSKASMTSQLGAGEAAPIDVRAVGKQRQHALRAELGEPMEVEVLAVDRRLIDLEVAGVNDDAGRRVDGERNAVGDAVRDADELDLERTDGHPCARADRDELAAGDAVLLQLGLDQRERQRRPVDRAVDVGQHVRHAADVIFVAVRQHERGGTLLLQVRQVGDDPIDTQQFRVGKHHAGVDDDRRVGPGEREHVHPELAESAERHDFEHEQTAGMHTVAPPLLAEQARERSRAAARSGSWARLKPTRRDVPVTGTTCDG